MLVLERHKYETINIGESQIKVLKIGENCVHIGINAPQHVRIWREDAKKQAPILREACNDDEMPY